MSDAAHSDRTGVGALLRGRCPRCREGKVFSGWIAMNPRCPDCGMVFEREQGYFVGAMYLSYGATLVLIPGLYGLVYYLAPRLTLGKAMVVTLLLFLPFVPFVFRYSRLLWMYFDRAVDRS